MRRAGWVVLLGALLTSPAAAASLDGLKADGWYTWRVEAAEGASGWCCCTAVRQAAGGDCELDSRHSGYVMQDETGPVNGMVQIYARLDSGKPVELRVLSPLCPVASDGGVSDLGQVDAGASFDWLRQWVRADSPVSEDALAAIAMHRGERPLEFLIDTAHGAAAADLRTTALFWLAQTGAAESEAVIIDAIAGDPDGDVREEAVFALSQLPEERAVDALTAVLEDRRLHREVRETALFWLAQSESDRALATVERLLVGDEG